MKKAIKFFEEEITRLENAPKINGCEMTDEWSEQIEICKIAKSAIEKQMPKKVEIQVFDDFDETTKTPYKMKFQNCSICGGFVGLKSHKFCPNCGQALDWSDTE